MTDQPDVVRLSRSRIFENVGFVPHDGQWPILKDPHRFKVVAAGRRFGKSVIGGHELLLEAFISYHRRHELRELGRRMEFWIVGPNYSDSEKEFRILWNRCKQQEMPFDKPGTYNDPIGGNMHISLWDGLFQVHAKSAAHPESLVGEGLHGVVVAEAAKVKEKVWTKYVRPTLNDFGGWAELTSTPEGKNWFYEAWQRGQDPSQEAWASWRRPSWMNPNVYPGGATDEQVGQIRQRLNARLPVTSSVIAEIGIDPEVAQLMMDLTEPMFKQEIAADFTEFVGRVFYDFDEEEHVGDFEYDPTWATYAAVDYGFTNPSVWLLLQVDPFGERVRVLDEVYERGLTAEEFAREIKRRGLCPSDTRTFYPDPASPGDTRQLEQILKVHHSGGTGGEIKHRIDAIRKALKMRNPHLEEGHVDRVPTLQFDRKCTYTIRDMLEYRYPDRRDEQDRNAPELPLKKDDHGPEALGRFFAGHYGTPAQSARRARVRRASMSG